MIELKQVSDPDANNLNLVDHLIIGKPKHTPGFILMKRIHHLPYTWVSRINAGTFYGEYRTITQAVNRAEELGWDVMAYSLGTMEFTEGF